MAREDDSSGKRPRSGTESDGTSPTRARTGRRPASAKGAAQSADAKAATAAAPTAKAAGSKAAAKTPVVKKPAVKKTADARSKPATAAKAAATTAAADTALTASTGKPAASKRAAAKRVRTADRVDTRTTNHRKPVVPKDGALKDGVRKDAEQAEISEGAQPLVTAADAAPQPMSSAGPVASAAAEGRVPPAGEPAEAAPSTTTAFMEAAFGTNSRLPERLVQNIERIESLTQRLVGAMSMRKPKNPGVEGPGADLFNTAASAWVKLLTEQPERVLSQQVSYWGETLRHFADAQAAIAKGTMAAPTDDGPADRRFANPLWGTHPFFNFIKRQYQINADAMMKAASDLDIAEMSDQRRIEWFTRQMIDMMAPTNFLATNPDALEKALATEGESLVKGLENLVRDVESHGGEMIVSLSDPDAFRVGENIGTSKGQVVARTRLYELIQYNPSTEKVHKIPLVIFPPWINKFYILDLKPQNSLIKWIVDQGYTLFVVAWKNPDPTYADTGMEDYVSCYLEVMDRIMDLTDQKKLNAIGYCIAGTTLSLTLSLLKQRGDDRVNSATFFTTLTDFSEQGEFTAFLQEDFLSGIEEETLQTGILSSQLMTRTFSFLRANDLVWGPAIRSYMLGETPPAFDLLFWNGDSTNLPGRMAIQYLRGLCQQNAFVNEGFELFGKKLHVRDVTVPLCAIACETDHIAPAVDSWRGVSLMGSRDKTFILSESGHIAGIINPPSKKKYGHYVSDHGFDAGFEAWRQHAAFHQGSWWPRWTEWLRQHSGAMTDSREPVDTFGEAPGQYVHERS